MRDTTVVAMYSLTDIDCSFHSLYFSSEIGFFDHYIIPLARQLQKCEIFGAMADECLEFAQRNRDRWEREGHVIVQQMVVDQMDDQDLLQLIDNLVVDCDELLG